MASPRPQPCTTNYDMFQQTQTLDCLAEVNEQTVDAFFNPTDMEGSNRGMNDALMGKVAPDTLIAAIHAQDTNLDDFDPDEIDYETLNANILRFPGLHWVLQDQSIYQQQQQPWSQEQRKLHYHVQSTPRDSTFASPLQNIHSAAIFRTTQPQQQWSQWSHPQQTPQGIFQQLYASSRPVQQFYAQSQTPWIKQESHGQGMDSIKQQQFDAHQYTTPDQRVPFPTERQGELQYPLPVHQTAPLSRAMAPKNKVSKQSSGNKRQKMASATPYAQPSACTQVPDLSPYPIATAAPQAIKFASFAEAQQAAATRVVPHNYTPPADDPSFPKDDAARKFYIRQMYDAYVDITQCIDRATTFNFDSHFATLSADPPTSPITPVMISTICWHLLSIAIDLHTRGPICLNVYDPAKLKNVYKHQSLKFSARIDKICELLRMSKSRCGNLLKLDSLGMVVANAPLLCRQTKSNYTHNGNRQRDLVMGKNIVAGKKREAAEMDGDGDEAE